MTQLSTNFSDRETLAAYLRAQFPKASALSPEISLIRGGRAAAEVQLQHIQLDQYTSTRNMLDGAVTRLSPYLRQGVITLVEVRRHILQQTTARKAYKLLQELTWRHYYQQVYQNLGDAIWQDIEPYKTGVERYAQALPPDIAKGKTGLVCIDTFSQDLRRVGYLHNHARMWTAAYIIHHRRVRWQAGAYWFLQHLLDGDPASNNLSWQWVASTFAAKPYYFNQENLARYTSNIYCTTCPLLHNGCPFEGSYEEVAARIFPTPPLEEQTPPEQTTLTQRLVHNSGEHKPEYRQIVEQDVIVWVNQESLNPYGPALSAHPQATPIFIFDETALDQAGWTLKRIAFIYECLLEIPAIQIYKGDSIAILKEILQTAKNAAIATTSIIDPHLQEQIRELAIFSIVRLYEIEALIAKEDEAADLRRFSRYWKKVERVVVKGGE